VHRYILGQFLVTFTLCVLASTSLFLVFDFFERMRVFFREDSSPIQAITYILFKIPLIVHFMTPVAVLIATLLSIGKLSQNSEITAMRACGISIFWLAKPLLAAGLAISMLMFIAGETVVPWASSRVEEIYHFDIRKKVEKGAFSRTDFWYRSSNQFYNVGMYDSRIQTLFDISIFELSPSFQLLRKIDAQKAVWEKPEIGWTMQNVIETTFDEKGDVRSNSFRELPLVITEQPRDFSLFKRGPETMSYTELNTYIKKLRNEGVPVTNYLVDLSSKISFPFVNVIVVLIALPFALFPARSGKITKSFVAGVSVGFGYYIVHAFSTALGAAELIPIVPSAWTANVLLGSIGGYLIAGAEHQK